MNDMNRPGFQSRGGSSASDARSQVFLVLPHRRRYAPPRFMTKSPLTAAGTSGGLEGRHRHHGPDSGGGNLERGGSLMNRPLKKSKL